MSSDRSFNVFSISFLSPFDKRDEADKVKRDVSNGNLSDHLTLLAAYNGWVRAQKKGGGAEREYLRKRFLSRTTLHMIRSMKRQFRALLTDIGFVQRSAVAPRRGQESRDSRHESRDSMWLETRVDGSDGRPYPKASFLSVYGGLEQWRRALPGPPLERRMDPSDGKPYTKASFIHVYGHSRVGSRWRGRRDHRSGQTQRNTNAWESP